MTAGKTIEGDLRDPAFRERLRIAAYDFAGRVAVVDDTLPPLWMRVSPKSIDVGTYAMQIIAEILSEECGVDLEARQDITNRMN